jgi:hypothetical protein
MVHELSSARFHSHPGANPSTQDIAPLQGALPSRGHITLRERTLASRYVTTTFVFCGGGSLSAHEVSGCCCALAEANVRPTSWSAPRVGSEPSRDGHLPDEPAQPPAGCRRTGRIATPSARTQGRYDNFTVPVLCLPDRGYSTCCTRRVKAGLLSHDNRDQGL